MIRLFCLLMLTATSASAQSLTLGFEGNGLSHTGIRFKYAHDYSKLQIAGYGAAAKGGILSFGDRSWSSNAGLAGVSLNILHDTSNKQLNFYYGVSVEGLVQNYKAKNSSRRYTDVSVLAGPQFGLNVYLSRRLNFNAEWGVRAGVRFGYVHHNVFSGVVYLRSFYARENTMFLYIPTSIGLTYKLGRVNKPTRE